MIEMTETIPPLSMERYPGPVCSYEHGEDSPVVRGENSTFEETFGPVTPGNPIVEELSSSGIEPAGGWQQLQHPFDQETSFPVAARPNGTAQTEYILQVVPPTDEKPGYLLLTESETPDSEFGVDRVASVISHDLRNPLDVAKARLRAGIEMDNQEHLEHVRQAHDRMERIIQDVLTLARGEEVIDPDGTVDLGEVARDAWETVETDGASLTVVNSLPSAVADRDRTKRLFENLFRNAVEHGGREVQISVGRSSDGFYVADDGSGIPADRREVVFEPGYSSTDHGTGLGLAIVRQIATVHGWTVSVTESEYGGARFEFEDVSNN